MFCNWLHNGKSSDMSAIEDGAYDASTFTLNDDGTFNDQATHHPDARFWIPTLDEWAKAAHYDPDRHGPGRGGWWRSSITSDDAPIYAPPSEGGQANAGFTLSGYAEWDIQLGAYPGVRSPWGLLDTAGATTEWIEESWPPTNPRYRMGDGSHAGSDEFEAEPADMVWEIGQLTYPWAAGSYEGIRIVSIVPAPSAALVLLSVVGLDLLRERKR